MGSPETVSPDTLLLYSVLPQYVQDQDAANGYPFLSWLEGGGSLLQTIDDLVRDDSDGNPGWSILFDITRCPTEYLPWLAQCVGVRFSPTQTSDAQQRYAIEHPQGWARGTVAQIAAVANALLADGYQVTILERTPDPYSYTVEIPFAGVMGGTWAELVAEYGSWTALGDAFSTWDDVLAQDTAITAALEDANPGGLVQTITFV